MPVRVLVLVAVLVLAGCGTRTVVDDPAAGDPEAPSTAAPSDLPTYDVELADLGSSEVPPVVLHLPDGTAHEVRPWAWCLPGAGCVDATWPKQPVDIGEPEWVDVTFGVSGWTFDATFHEPRTGDVPVPHRRVSAQVDPRGEHTFRVLPAGRAGTWHVDLFGTGDNGDVITTVAWTTTTDGAFPEAGSGQAAVLASDDGLLTSYGVALSLSDLPRTPDEASASIEVVSDNGRRTTLDLGEPAETWTTGAVSWSLGHRLGERAAALGGRRFTYRATVVLDGVTHVGTGTWPDDTTEEITPAVPLRFSPPLPAYGPG